MYDSVSPRRLNELSNQGIEALVDLIMPMKPNGNDQTIDSFSLRRRRPQAHLANCSPSCACSANFGESSQALGSIKRRMFLLGHGRAWRRCVSGQAVRSEWATAKAVSTIPCGLPKASDHAYQRPRRNSGHKFSAAAVPAAWCSCSKEGGTSSCPVWMAESVEANEASCRSGWSVDDMSLQRFGDQDQVAQDLEQASKCLAHAGTARIEHLRLRVIKVAGAVGAARVQASTAEQHLGVDFTSAKRASTAVRRARLDERKGRVGRVRKSGNPLRTTGAQRNAAAAVPFPGSFVFQQSVCMNRVPRWC